jgi:transmembrane sensor
MDTHHIDYTTFDAVQLAMDERFAQWVRYSLPEENLFWSRLRDEHPEMKERIQDARVIVASLQASKSPFSSEDMEAVWQRLSEQHDLARPAVRTRHRFIGAGVWKAAAAILAIALSATLWWSSRPERFEFSNGFGQSAAVVLPDRSVVTLNANSSMVFEQGAWWNPARTAQLKGEAFFDVSHIRRLGRPVVFEVQTDQMNVHVTGTRFNVYNRRGTGKVFLQSGSVFVSVPGASNSRQPLDPGQLATAKGRTGKIEITGAEQAVVTAWMEQKLVFNQTPLIEVLHLMQDQFGLSFVLESQYAARKTFTGELPADDAGILIKAMEASFDLSIRRENNTLIITDKKQN